jgi:hypothetical protein
VSPDLIPTPLRPYSVAEQALLRAPEPCGLDRPPAALCPFGTCVACEIEQLIRFDEKLQYGRVDSPGLVAMRQEFGAPDWLAEKLDACGFVVVDVVRIQSAST